MNKGFTLSKPSKMPCNSFSIPAIMCKTGSKLRKIEGSVCAKCYAHKGFYNMPNVRQALAARLRELRDPQWVERMVAVIRANESSGYFRWHDSGDLQGIWHLRNIVEVAKRMPDIRFWLPTKEERLVERYRKLHGKEPSNLTIRVSAHMVGEVCDAPVSSMVVKKGTTPLYNGVWTCPAKDQGNKCLTCRACWDPKVRIVAYLEH